MLELKGIRWQLESGEEILKDVSLTVPDGKLTVITGPNGGGKTSLAKIMPGLKNRQPERYFLTERILPTGTLPNVL